MSSEAPKPRQPRLSVGIIAHPSRLAHVETMRRALDLGDRQLTVSVDELEEGPWANSQKAWRSYDPEATHHLVMEDDLLLCKDLLAGVERALRYVPEGIFATSIFHFADFIREAHERGSSWAISHEVTGAAMVLKTSRIDEWLDWSLLNVKQSLIYNDWRVRMFCAHHKQPIWHTVPTLIEHLGAASSLAGQKASIGDVERTSKAFLGAERSALEIDFSRGAKDPPYYRGIRPNQFTNQWAFPRRRQAKEEPASVDVRVVELEKITPYPENPRLNERAVAGVARSIELYGYNQPMVVDKNLVVIAGHTRLAALKQLGWLRAEVIVSPLSAQKAREARIADNKTGEKAKWDRGYLMAELRQGTGAREFFGESEMNSLLNENLGSSKTPLATSKTIERRDDYLTHQHERVSTAAAGRMLEIHCTHCNAEFALDRENALASQKLERKDESWAQRMDKEKRRRSQNERESERESEESNPEGEQ